ncbi:hypothetical protein [Streptomyces sp. NPDC007100]|uniref:hypothetical protein n=1 Tax=Streptomyces sp. NPDC007100 TaxID=3155602 RepID=UPI003411EF82
MFFDDFVRVRAGVKTDRGGNQVPDWSAGAVSRLTVTDVNVQPNTQVETADPTRTVVVTGWRVQSAPGTAPDVRAVDRIEWRGLLLEVEGEVAEWSDPTDGSPHHIEFTMQRATG